MKHLVVPNCLQMDSEGILQNESAIELVENIIKDPEEIKELKDFLHSCFSGDNDILLLFIL